VTATAALSAWVEDFAHLESSPERIDAVVERFIAGIAADVEAIDDQLLALIREAVQQHWRGFVAQITTGAGFTLPPAAGAVATELARGHRDLADLLAIYRAAQRAAWAYAIEVVAAAPAEISHEDLLILFWTQAGDWFDASVEASLLVFGEEARLIERRGDARRYDAIRRVLAGEAIPPGELSALLGGYPVSGDHIALILTALSPDALGLLEPAALRLAAHLGSARPLVVRPGGREVWAWVPARTWSDPASDLLAHEGVRLSVGGPHQGLAGLVAAHEDARAALPVAVAGGPAPTHYADVAALTILARDPEAATRFARQALGRLADPGAGRLRETVEAVISSGGVNDSAAARLGVHKNTVRYRLGQAERLLGHPVATRLGDLALALDWWRRFESAAGDY
jgi:hypothetical protein